MARSRQISETILVSHFTVAQASELSGLSEAMLNYLCRSKVLEPSMPVRRGRGRKRLYSFGDVLILRAISRMLQAGVSILNMKKAFHQFARRHTITSEHMPATHLVTDGKSIYFMDRAGTLEALTSGQTAFSFVLELSKDHVNLRRNAKRLLQLSKAA